jgi:hypothetical protein
MSTAAREQGIKLEAVKLAVLTCAPTGKAKKPPSGNSRAKYPKYF